MMTKTTLKNRQNVSLLDHNSNVSEYYTSSLIHGKGSPKVKEMKHRGISDIIAVLLLLAITVAGAVLVSAFFSGNAIFRPDASNTGTQSASVKIIGYDTRDGVALSGITNLDNVLGVPIPYLRTNSTALNNLPTDAPEGNEFIVLTVRNQGINKVTLQSVEINGVEHSWDGNTANDDLIATSYPDDGTFSIVPTSNTIPPSHLNIVQSPTNVLERNGEARLVIKLSSDITPSIELSQPIRTRIITDLLDPSAIIISSGGVR